MPSPANSTTGTEVLPSTLGLNLEDLELLHHFVTVVYLTLSNGPAIQRMWQIDLPKEALSHPYLMHGILAFSALHLVHLSPHNTENYRRAAVRHQDIALGAPRPLLNQVTAQNCDALCATTTIIGMFAAGLHQLSSNGTSSPIEGLLEIGEFARGVYVVVQAADEWYRKGKVGPMMNLIPWDNVPPLAPDIQTALEDLHKLVGQSDGNEEKKTVYYGAIRRLKEAFDATTTNSYHPSLCFSWLVFIDREMFNFMKNDDPIALIISAHYGVILQGSSAQWWFVILKSQTSSYSVFYDTIRCSIFKAVLETLV
jgi:hypothetical protein